MAQVTHAAFEFAHENPSLVSDWLVTSNYLIIVSVDDEDDIVHLITMAGERDIKRKIVREPDIGNEITAVAFEPGQAAKKLCANLPLAMREKVLA